MENIGKGAFWFFLVACIVCVIGYGYAEYVIKRDVTDYLERAQVASDATDMYKHLTSLKTGMETYGMTRGYAAFIFTKPSNNMEFIYQSVSRSHERIGEACEFDTTTEAGVLQYDTRLDDVRGVLRELQIPAMEFWWRHTPVGLMLMVIGWSSFILVCFIGLIWLIAW